MKREIETTLNCIIVFAAGFLIVFMIGGAI
jgi:hypothetical protein